MKRRDWTKSLVIVPALLLGTARCGETNVDAMGVQPDNSAALAAVGCADGIDACIEECGFGEVCETLELGEGESHEVCMPDAETEACHVECMGDLDACLANDLPEEPSCEEFLALCKEGCALFEDGPEGCEEECDYANGVCTGEIVIEDPCNDAFEVCEVECGDFEEVCETIEGPEGEEEICHPSAEADECLMACWEETAECYGLPEEPDCDELLESCQLGCEDVSCDESCEYDYGVCTGEIVVEDPCGDELQACVERCEPVEAEETCETIEGPDGEEMEICQPDPAADECMMACFEEANDCYGIPDDPPEESELPAPDLP
ncbi:hypothetical protein ACFL6C_07485 [Myxococcota bacterium]